MPPRPSKKSTNQNQSLLKRRRTLHPTPCPSEPAGPTPWAGSEPAPPRGDRSRVPPSQPARSGWGGGGVSLSPPFQISLGASYKGSLLNSAPGFSSPPPAPQLGSGPPTTGPCTWPRSHLLLLPPFPTRVPASAVCWGLGWLRSPGVTLGAPVFCAGGIWGAAGFWPA